MARFVIEFNDGPSGTTIQTGGISDSGHNIDWETLRKKHAHGLVAPGAESMAYAAVNHVLELTAKLKMNLLAPAPKVFMGNSFQKRHKQ